MIGHCHLTHGYLLKGEEQPQCIPCDTPLTVKDIMIDCNDFEPIRSQYYDVDSLKELFDTINVDVILSFSKEIGLFNRF